MELTAHKAEGQGNWCRAPMRTGRLDGTVHRGFTIEQNGWGGAHRRRVLFIFSIQNGCEWSFSLIRQL
jgi:hypothetical protein